MSPRAQIALGFMTAFISSPLFAEQCEEAALHEHDDLKDLGERTAIDAFDLADAFLEVAKREEATP